MNFGNSILNREYLGEEMNTLPKAVGCNKLQYMLSDRPRSLTIWLDSKEAAQFLMVSVPMLRNMVSNGQVPHYKLGRRNRYRQD